MGFGACGIERERYLDLQLNEELYPFRGEHSAIREHLDILVSQRPSSAKQHFEVRVEKGFATYELDTFAAFSVCLA